MKDDLENLVVTGFVEGKGNLFDVFAKEERSDTNGTHPLCIREICLV